MAKASKTTVTVAAAPSSNWKALKQALHPGAISPSSGAAVVKRKRSRHDEQSATPEPKGKGKQLESDTNEHKRSVNHKKELPIMDILQGPTHQWQQDVGQYLAIDCEMVGVGPEGVESTLARVSIVNYHGAVMLDRFVSPREKVTDYRTWVSGVREEDLRNAPTFTDVQKEVSELIKGRILVGHAISNDTQVLLLSHPHNMTRDTAKYAPLQGLARTKRPGLKVLAKLVLGVDIQAGEHSSIDDARATMAVYRSQKSAWEESVRIRSKPSLITTTTPALAALDLSAISLTGVGKNANRPKTSLGLAATLRQVRHDAAEEDKAGAEMGEQELEVREVKKARREEVDDLVLGFDFDKPAVRAAEEVAPTAGKKKGKEEEGKDGTAKKKVKKVAGRAFKGDREKRPQSRDGWWED